GETIGRVIDMVPAAIQARAPATTAVRLVETSAQRLSVAASSVRRGLDARAMESWLLRSGLWMFKRRLRCCLEPPPRDRSPDLDARQSSQPWCPPIPGA